MISLGPKRRVESSKSTAPAVQLIPGEIGIWLLVLLDLAVFALFFIVIAIYRVTEPAEFFNGHEYLDKNLAVVNTIVLVTGSLAVVRAVQSMRASSTSSASAARFLYAAVACGAVFVGVKAVEYTHLFGTGITINTSVFFLCYIGFTMVHLVHVLIGMTVLATIGRRVAQGRASVSSVESSALYWHMVDLLWLILFPLLYLI